MKKETTIFETSVKKINACSIACFAIAVMALISCFSVATAVGRDIFWAFEGIEYGYYWFFIGIAVFTGLGFYFMNNLPEIIVTNHRVIIGAYFGVRYDLPISKISHFEMGALDSVVIATPSVRVGLSSVVNISRLYDCIAEQIVKHQSAAAAQSEDDD